jgi:hypothetical protein
MIAMAKDLKKFVNPKFTRTIDLRLLQRLLERHEAGLQGVDFALFGREPNQARRAIQDFFAGPEDNYPEGLVADLHRIAELANANGLRLLLEQAARHSVSLAPVSDDDQAEAKQDPKQVALRVFLDHPAVFDAAADMISYTTLSSFTEFASDEEGVEAQLDDTTRTAFEDAAKLMFEAELRGRYCRVGWYDDDDEINIVVTHGAPLTTTEVIEGGADRVISFREAEHAVLSYSATNGRLKVGGFAKARRADLAEIFATTMLKRPQFFAAPDAQNLYTLIPVERAGFGFTFNHAHDPSIRRVQITEVQADRIGADSRSGKTRTLWSHVTRDGRDNALARMGETTRGINFGADWRLNHITIRAHIDIGEPKPARVTVKVKPPGTANFKRHRFEGRIMTLLRRNGLVHDRQPDHAAVAAE